MAEERRPSLLDRLTKGRQAAEDDLDRHVASIETDYRHLERISRRIDRSLEGPPTFAELVQRLARRALPAPKDEDEADRADL